MCVDAGEDDLFWANVGRDRRTTGPNRNRPAGGRALGDGGRKVVGAGPRMPYVRSMGRGTNDSGQTTTASTRKEKDVAPGMIRGREGLTALQERGEAYAASVAKTLGKAPATALMEFDDEGRSVGAYVVTEAISKAFLDMRDQRGAGAIVHDVSAESAASLRAFANEVAAMGHRPLVEVKIKRASDLIEATEDGSEISFASAIAAGATTLIDCGSHRPDRHQDRPDEFEVMTFGDARYLCLFDEDGTNVAMPLGKDTLVMFGHHGEGTDSVHVVPFSSFTAAD